MNNTYLWGTHDEPPYQTYTFILLTKTSMDFFEIENVIFIDCKTAPKTDPAYYPDRSLPAHAADTPALSYSKAEIPGSKHCQVPCLQS